MPTSIEIARVCNSDLFPTWRKGTRDLELGEFAHGAAVAYDWLFHEISPARRRYLRENLVTRVLQPAIDTYAAGRWWDAPVKLSNWNLVVNGGVIAAALAVGRDGDNGEREYSAQALELALASLERSIRYFGPQGGTPEGPGYWIYATEYLIRALLQ